MSDDFPAFALSEEHEALRQAVRALADDKIAPRAADIDRTSEFPWDVYEVLVKADFQAVHIPEAYGGAGADAIATAIVIEEVARACASSSLIPAVNKLGTMPLMLAASEDVKARYLAPVARGVDFQGLQFMIADMAMKLEAARQLTYAAAARSERAMAGEKIGDLTFFSSACKCLASDVAMSVTTDAVQLLGGYGYVNDYPVERMMRDAKITQIYEGTNQIQRMVMARQLLKG